MRRAGALALVVALAVTAGCVGPVNPLASTGSTDDGATTRLSTAGASLEIDVTDPSIRPIAGANVTVETPEGTRTTSSDAAGAARLADLEPGRAIVHVEVEAHQGRRLTLDLEAGERVEQTVVLRPDPENRTFVERFAFSGFFECSATYLIVAGDCLAPVDAVASEAGLEPPEDATNERNLFRFPVEAGWSEIRIEQTWEDPVAGAGSTMRVNLEPVDPNATGGHSPQYAEADGTSPVEIGVEAGQLHPTASSDEMVVPEEGGWLRTRTFHLGLAETDEPAGTDFLGVGGAIQQEFTVTVEVVYR